MRFKLFEKKSYRSKKRSGGKSSAEPRELKIADVTNDGKNDLVTVIHDRIIIYPQYWGALRISTAKQLTMRELLL